MRFTVVRTLANPHESVVTAAAQMRATVDVRR